ALLAASYVKASVTIPVHYGTWPIIESDPLEFVDRLYKEYGQEGLHVKPGMKIIL
ncbi:MAG: metal-dependent hydrolase, partial [Megasphaera micronuciformis]|nr:metal-dependent hydrolase [Megasphaera micronuciformis]